jgi:hypothetical protein
MFQLESQSESLHEIHKLHPAQFQTTHDNIYWEKNAANSVIRHWLNYLSSICFVQTAGTSMVQSMYNQGCGALVMLLSMKA